MQRDTFQNEIVQSTGYMQTECQSIDRIHRLLETAGYTQETQHAWIQGTSRAFVRLVDDISSTVDLHSTSPRDTIITDNYINHAISGQIKYLPTSWWGMYAYQPTVHHVNELKDYSFLINRIDESRMRLMLSLFKRKHLHEGVINFNCVTPRDWNDDSHETRSQNWKDHWELLGPALKEHYIGEYQRLTAKMPFRNHDFTHDQALWASRLNIVVETYSSDDVIAFSEKTFAALCIPRPWTLFGGRCSVARLRNLGFDVLDNLVDHGYDRLTKIQDKYPQFVECCLNSIVDPMKHRDRLESAALHNQKLLHTWKTIAEKDFQNWLTDLGDHLKI